MEDDILAYAALMIVGLIVIDGTAQNHYAQKSIPYPSESLQAVYAEEKAFLNNQEINQMFSKTAEDEFLKEKFLQLENKRKVLEEKANEIRKAVEEYKNEFNSLEKINNEENNALKKNMSTHQNAQAVVKGHSVKPCQLIIKQKENVRV